MEITFSKIETLSWKTRLFGLEICNSPNSLETLKVHMEITFLQELENILSLGKFHFLGWKFEKFVFLAHTNLARQGESLAERRQKIRRIC